MTSLFYDIISFFWCFTYYPGGSFDTVVLDSRWLDFGCEVVVALLNGFFFF